MSTVPNGYSAVGGIDPLVMSAIHGVVLALLVIGFLRLPSWLPFARIVKALIAFFVLFLLIDDLVNGSLRADIGLLCGAALTLAVAAHYRRWHRRRTAAG
ncbi:MAG TPA: hypothetical protein VHA53_04935 [Nitrolancea sp.]|nr:hypothetical protein [Nitrolancea sp.]